MKGQACLAIGDSITHGVPYVQLGETYPELVGQMTGDRVINLGIGGITVAEMAMELPSHLEQYMPGIVILSGGGNDIDYGRSAAEIMMDLEDMARTITDAHVRLVLCTITPSSLGKDDEATREEVNGWIRRNEGGLWDLADIDDVLRDTVCPSMLKPDVDSGDHVHPNAKGMGAIADVIIAAMNES